MKEKQVNKATYIAALIIKGLQESLQHDEQTVLNDWAIEDAENFLLKEELQNPDKTGQSLAAFTSFDVEKGLTRLQQKLNNL